MLNHSVCGRIASNVDPSQDSLSLGSSLLLLQVQIDKWINGLLSVFSSKLASMRGIGIILGIFFKI
jgi:hypothetical protein